MWDRIIGALGLAWGGYVIGSTLLRTVRDGAFHATGGPAGLVLALLFMVGGAFYFFRGSRNREPEA
jgi:hypothetical protein